MKAGKREGKESRVTIDSLLSLGFSEARAQIILQQIRDGETRQKAEKKHVRKTH